MEGRVELVGTFLFLSPHFLISQYFLSPLGLKKEEKISYQKRIYSL
jgi:hypothetical protein